MIGKTVMKAIVQTRSVGVGLIGCRGHDPQPRYRRDGPGSPVDRPADLTGIGGGRDPRTSGMASDAAARSRSRLSWSSVHLGPNTSTGWHSHPGQTLVMISSGTMSFYHAEHCMEEIEYRQGQSFSNLPDEIHMARNEGSVDLVIYASDFVPAGAPLIRIDQPSPGVGCPAVERHDRWGARSAPHSRLFPLTPPVPLSLEGSCSGSRPFQAHDRQGDPRRKVHPREQIARTNGYPTSVIARTNAEPNVSAGSGLARRPVDGRGRHPLRRHGQHFAEYVAFGVFFSVVAWSQAVWAVGVIVQSRGLLLVGLVGNTVVILVWLFSRTTGLPIGPEAGAPEPAAFIDVLSTILEVAIVAGMAILVLRERPAPSMRGLPVRLGLAVLVITLAVLTTVRGGRVRPPQASMASITEITTMQRAPDGPGLLAIRTLDPSLVRVIDSHHRRVKELASTGNDPFRIGRSGCVARFRRFRPSQDSASAVLPGGGSRRPSSCAMPLNSASNPTQKRIR